MKFGTEFWIAVPAIAALIALAFTALGHLWRKVLRPLALMAVDWNGTEPRVGVPGRAGVMHRLSALEAGQETAAAAMAGLSADLTAIRAELSPNSGRSMADQVGRIATAVGADPRA